jgi:hypothetical protein
VPGVERGAVARASRWKAAPRQLAAVAVLVGVEGLGLMVLAAVLAVETVISPSESAGGAAALAVFVLAAGAGLLFCGRGLLLRQRWSRAPTAVAQLCALPVAVTMIRAGQQAPGVALLVVTGAVLVLLFTPTVVRETAE